MGVVYQFPWEVALIEFIQSIIADNSILRSIFVFFTQFGEAFMAVLIIGFFYWSYNKDIGRDVGLNVIFAEVTNSMVKNLFFRIRPYAANETIDCLNEVEPGYDIYDMDKQGYSFPSGHSTNITTTVLSIAMKIKNNLFLVIGTLFIIMVGFSRFALGVHYPTDVLFGILLGILTVTILTFLRQKLSRNVLYAILSVIGAVGIVYCRSNDYYSSLGLLYGFIAGDLFDSKYVNFRNTRNVLKTIIRTIFGALIFLAITSIMKMPFSHETLEAHTYFAYLYRVFRYGLACFVVIGLYPILFKYNIFKLDDKMN